MLAVVAGGTLIQDIATRFQDALEHEQPTDLGSLGTLFIFRMIDGKIGLVSQPWKLNTSSSGRWMGQCVVTGRADDGIIEAIN